MGIQTLLIPDVVGLDVVVDDFVLGYRISPMLQLLLQRGNKGLFQYPGRVLDPDGYDFLPSDYCLVKTSF